MNNNQIVRSDQEMLDENKVSLSLIKRKFPTRLQLWKYLFQVRKLHLPHYHNKNDKDKCLTWTYLLDIFFEKVVFISRVGINLPDKTLVSSSSEEIAAKILEVAKKPVVTCGNLPMKDWLLEVLFNLNPKDKIFSGIKVPEFYRDVNSKFLKELNSLPDIEIAGARHSDLYSQEERKQVLNIFENRKKVKTEKSITKLTDQKDLIELKIIEKKKKLQG